MPLCDKPGPGPYGKPSATGYMQHDFTLKRNPAFSFGLRHKDFSNYQTPGPYYIGNVTNVGKHPNVGCKLVFKPNEKRTEVTAGPADYYTEGKRRPGISFGLKNKRGDGIVSPGPADYYNPPKKSGGWTMGLKSQTKMSKDTPGPYPLVELSKYKSKAPTACIAGKGVDYGPSRPGPGPAIYSGDKSSAPAYTFGLKHHQCSLPLITAADNDYPTQT